METLNQFGVNPILLAAQIVNFFILLWILKRFLYGPILKVLAERRKKIEDSLKNAEEIEKKLQQTEEQAEKIIADALQESQKILNQTNDTAAQILEETNKTAEQIMLKAQAEAQKIILREKEILMHQMRANIASLVVLALEKVSGKKITGKEHLEIIEKEIKNLS